MPLIGTTWTEESFEATNCEDGSDENVITCSGEECEVIIFNSDGTVTYNQSASETEYTYSVNGNQLTLTVNNDFSTTVTFEIVSDQLFVTIEDQDSGCTEIYTYQGS